MTSKINKADLIKIISEKGHLTLRDANVSCNILFSEIISFLKNNQEVNITNFGSFSLRKRNSKVGTNPKTHEKILISDGSTIFFKPSKNVKKEINK